MAGDLARARTPVPKAGTRRSVCGAAFPEDPVVGKVALAALEGKAGAGYSVLAGTRGRATDAKCRAESQAPLPELPAWTPPAPRQGPLRLRRFASRCSFCSSQGFLANRSRFTLDAPSPFGREPRPRPHSLPAGCSCHPGGAAGATAFLGVSRRSVLFLGRDLGTFSSPFLPYLGKPL